MKIWTGKPWELPATVQHSNDRALSQEILDIPVNPYSSPNMNNVKMFSQKVMEDYTSRQINRDRPYKSNRLLSNDVGQLNLIQENRNKKSLLPFGSPQIAGKNHRNLISLNPTVVAHSRDYALVGNKGLNPSSSGVSLPPISNFKASVDGES